MDDDVARNVQDRVDAVMDVLHAALDTVRRETDAIMNIIASRPGKRSAGPPPSAPAPKMPRPPEARPPLPSPSFESRDAGSDASDSTNEARSDDDDPQPTKESADLVMERAE